MDEGVFFETAFSHLPVVRGLVRNMLRHDADAEDALQETLLQAFSKRHQLRVPESLRPWLIQIAINEARKLRRNESTRLTSSLDQPAGDAEHPAREIPDPCENPSQMLERSEIHALVRREIAKLPEPDREVLVLCDIEGFCAEAAARRLGISKARVRTSLQRARAKLREGLALIGRTHQVTQEQTTR